mgnify:CR=1 FL=1
MNLPSLKKFESSVVQDGLVIYNTSLVEDEPEREDIEVLGIPATKIADELGNTRVANMVVLGAYIEYTSILTKEIVFEALPHFIKRSALIEINKEAIEKGIEFVRHLKP